MLSRRRRNQYLFKPTNISGIAAWYDAARLDSITKDGSNLVSSWADRSGNSKHLTQATGGAQPLYVASALNAKPVIRTDGVNDSLVSPAMGFSGDQTLTILAVFKQTTGGIVCGFSASTGGGWYNEKWNHLVATAANSAGAATSYHLRTVTKAAGTFQANAVQRVNGSAVTNTYSGSQVTTYVPNLLSSHTFGVGTYLGSFGANDFAEIIIYNRVLNATELAKVESYLKRKWGL